MHMGISILKCATQTVQILELQDVGSRHPSMESLTGAADGAHLHPGHQYNNQRRSPSLRYLFLFCSLTTTYFHKTQSSKDAIHLFYVLLNFRRRAGSPLVRTPSPRKRNHLHPNHDIGFSDTVSNVVEIVKEEKGHRGYRQHGHGRFPRGTFHEMRSVLNNVSPFPFLCVFVHLRQFFFSFFVELFIYLNKMYSYTFVDQTSLICYLCHVHSIL